MFQRMINLIHFVLATEPERYALRLVNVFNELTIAIETMEDQPKSTIIRALQSAKGGVRNSIQRYLLNFHDEILISTSELSKTKMFFRKLFYFKGVI